MKPSSEPTLEPTSRTLSLSTGLSYHVLEWAPADPACDHTVVLLHGILDLGRAWKPVIDAGLAGRFHLVAPDMRGHGDSDRAGPGGYYYFLDYLPDLHDLLAQVGRGRVSLVGHSMGGSVAAFYTGVFPDRVHRLAVLEGMGPPERRISVPERLARWIQGWQKARAEEPRTYADVAEAADRLRKHDPLLAENLALELARYGTVATPDGRVRFKHDPLHTVIGPYPFRVDYARELWQNITCPVLLIEASQSELLAHIPDIEARNASIPHAQRLVLQDAGHNMQRHQPEAIASALVEFLSQ